MNGMDLYSILFIVFTIGIGVGRVYEHLNTKPETKIQYVYCELPQKRKNDNSLTSRVNLVEWDLERLESEVVRASTKRNPYHRIMVRNLRNRKNGSKMESKL